jgi:biotin/methionine sulfoxide reductase
MVQLTAMHWGVYEVARDRDGTPSLRPFSRDQDPSPIGLHGFAPQLDRLRIRRPAVRAGWLDPRTRGETARRGRDLFVEIAWNEALDLVAAELRRIVDTHGNETIFGGSYGWGSAGRFHHPQSQLHRFLNGIGGYVRHVDSYSLGAGHVLLPHIVANAAALTADHTAWEVLEQHTKLFVTFGGVPAKNAQVSAGGAVEHRVPGALRRMARAGVCFVNISPTRDDLDTGGTVEWIPVRPNTDTALMLALMLVLHREGLADTGFLRTHCTGAERFVAYLTGAADGVPKTPDWAEAITGVPASRITTLAREMAGTRTLLNIAWSLQRAHHGEQPYWALVTLAAFLGGIGLPGGGFGLGYGATNQIGSGHPRFGGPTLPQGDNRVGAFIPVARIADMLLHPGENFTYNGATHAYPDIRLIYWAGGNPFHHHQDLYRLVDAWRRPETVVVHEQFWNPLARMADIVLPATTALERDDIGYADRESAMIAMKQVSPPPGEARDDHAIFRDLAARLGTGSAFTENLDERAWLRRLYAESRTRAERVGVRLPEFDAFWEAGIAFISGGSNRPPVLLEAFREDPEANPLATPSGRIEIFSERIASFGLPDCPGHPVWLEPAEWLGADRAAKFPLHLISDQPADKLHSQWDPSPHSEATKVAGRQPVFMHPQDARARGLEDGAVVRVFNDRGACLAGLRVSPDVRPGVVRLSTGAWFDPDPDGPHAAERHGNPNVLTRDVGASSLSQGCTAQTCLVEIARFEGTPPPVTAFELPAFATRP